MISEAELSYLGILTEYYEYTIVYNNNINPGHSLHRSPYNAFYDQSKHKRDHKRA